VGEKVKPGQTNTAEFIAALRRQFPEIVLFGERRLYEPAAPIGEKEFGSPRITEAAEALTELIHNYREFFGVGGGFAANQVRTMPLVQMTGMVLTPGQVVIACNPRLTAPVGRAHYYESCASGPELACKVEEPWGQTLHYQDPSGESHSLELVDIKARLAAHEVRHLRGQTCDDPGIALDTRPIIGGIDEIAGLPPLERIA